eukprot:m.106690 g.106690  ORF g.106690 m.106690 type:complete len:477 (+) comp37268_c0_seq3:487-1917(+)
MRDYVICYALCQTDMEEMPSLEDSYVTPAARSDASPPSENRKDSEPMEMAAMSKDRRKAISNDDVVYSLYGYQEVIPLDPNLVLSSMDQGRVDSSRVYFPKEVSLCKSSIPGDLYGVYTKLLIPAGTWMGPFQGTPVLVNHLTADSKIDMMWEVFRNGQLVHYVDASQSPPSNWMKYIQCARSQQEQNMIVFQYKMNIFYRASRDIHPGEELLVWYGSSEYDLVYGVPTGIEEILGEETVRFPGKQNVTHIPVTAAAMQHSIASSQTQQPPTTATTTVTTPVGGPYPLPVPPVRQNGHGQPPTNLSLSDVGMVASEVTSTSAGGSGGESPATRDREEWNLWKCGQCFRSFTQRIMLQNHICESRADMPFHCGHCNRVFSTSNELRSHVISHSNDRPFVCGFCHRSFAGATTLANHMRTHTGERPFKCPQCNKGFTQGTQLARHMRMPGECVGGLSGLSYAEPLSPGMGSKSMHDSN